MRDDDLEQFEAHGAPRLPIATEEGWAEHDGARIWYAVYGAGPPVVMLHGGLGHSGNWGYQVPVLVGAGYQVVLVDSRGHGRSTRDARPFSYERMASDVLAVTDLLRLDRVAVVGWSDGACIALILAWKAPARIAGVFFFGCNMDPSGTKPLEFTPRLRRCLSRHAQDYAHLSATPDQFDAFREAVSLMMQTQPDFSAADLAEVLVPVAIVQSEQEEFITREHAEYLAHSIPGASLTILPGVSHFAPLQRPELFNQALLAYVGQTFPGSRPAPIRLPAEA